MLEKGKQKHIDNLRIIQLCEADLNFILHVILGKPLMRQAIHNLDKAQFAIPGPTCHNAVISKLLYLDLSRQTFLPGHMIDYDAKVAFDRVISGIAHIACQRFGLPKNCWKFYTQFTLQHVFSPCYRIWQIRQKLSAIQMMPHIWGKGSFRVVVQHVLLIFSTQTSALVLTNNVPPVLVSFNL
jgi:hypothetical protein